MTDLINEIKKREGGEKEKERPKKKKIGKLQSPCNTIARLPFKAQNVLQQAVRYEPNPPPPRQRRVWRRDPVQASMSTFHINDLGQGCWFLLLLRLKYSKPVGR